MLVSPVDSEADRLDLPCRVIDTEL